MQKRTEKLNLLPAIEFASEKKIHSFQEKKLAQLLKYVAKNSKYYQSVFKKKRIDINQDPYSILAKLPFTTKDDLAKHNDDFLCVPKNKVADFVTTSGTLSDPVAFYLTKKDVERLAYNECISLQCANGSKNDIYQLMTTIDKRFMAGLAYYLGVTLIDAGIVRVGPGAPYLQWDSIQRFHPTVLIAIPSFIPLLLKYAQENNIDYNSSSVKSIVCIGEPVRNADFTLNELGKRITSQWNVKLYSTYASTEMGAAFTECEYGIGGHLHAELLILEVVDEKGKTVKEGEVGEVVITTLGVEGMPLIRYRTGDLCNVYFTPCKCGRNTTRLGPIVARKQQMIKYKGTTIFPAAIFDVLNMVHEIDLFQIEIARDEFENDLISILLPSEIYAEAFEHTLNSLFKSKLRVTPVLKFIKRDDLIKKTLKEDKRKPERIIYI